MRYAINFDTTINQLVPYYMGGRTLILFLQACIKPLQKVNDAFVAWAKETRIEASMTSQTFKFEWYLNRKFAKYFEDPTQKITIQSTQVDGIPVYYQNVSEDGDTVYTILYHQNENNDSAHFSYKQEAISSADCSFIVNCPALRKNSTSSLLKPGITEKEFLAMLRHTIDKYKLSGKTYKIIINK